MPGDEAYLSGEPLHVLALRLGLKLREELGAGFPVSFSAGIDSANVAERGRVRLRAGDELHGPPAPGRLPAPAPAGRGPRGGDGRRGRRDAARLHPEARGDRRAPTSPTPRSRITAARRRQPLGDERYAAAPHGNAAAEDRVAPAPPRLHQLRQVHPRLPERRELRVRDAAPDDRLPRSRRPGRAPRAGRGEDTGAGRREVLAAPARELGRRLQRLRQLRRLLPRGRRPVHREAPPLLVPLLLPCRRAAPGLLRPARGRRLARRPRAVGGPRPGASRQRRTARRFSGTASPSCCSRPPRPRLRRRRASSRRRRPRATSCRWGTTTRSARS